MKKLILLSSVFLACGCSGGSDPGGSVSNGTSWAELRSEWVKDSSDCLSKVDQVIASAKAQTVTADDVFSLQTSIQRSGCASNYFPEQLLTESYTVNSDYLAKGFQWETGIARIASLRIWFTHQLIHYPDPVDPTIKHEGWSTWKHPEISLQIQDPPSFQASFGLSDVANYQFTNPIEQVKAEMPSYIHPLNLLREGRFEVSLNVEDRGNALAKTWVAEFTLNTPKLEIAKKWQDIRLLERDIITAFAGLTGFGHYNDVQPYEKIKSDLVAIRELLNQI